MRRGVRTVAETGRAEHWRAGDAIQRMLRSRFRARLVPSVRTTFMWRWVIKLRRYGRGGVLMRKLAFGSLVFLLATVGWSDHSVEELKLPRFRGQVNA